ncbi:substrate-binding domain-containing protein [Pigmentiphaga soli]|uniref:Substrate-binding domain-containing protein n=1 Tax=Pigmentiphaga soli TaxID=1007095 RepID=A0ABP8GV71_9BURK
MSSRSPDHARPARRGALAAAALLLGACHAAGANAGGPAPLRVCADPDNLPFSRSDGSGFENRIARLLADDMHVPLEYAWLPDRRGFVRKTMGAGLCDVIVGVPAGFEPVDTTAPYYRSGFVFVGRAPAQGQADMLRSFDDPRLPSLRIGVLLIGIDPGTSPVGYALARHGAIDHVVGYTLYDPEPPAQRMIEAIAAGRLDSALLWGPQAGYFARRAAVPLEIAPARPPADMAAFPFEFSIAMGVRKGDEALRRRLDDFIVRRRHDIDAVLAEYGVPRTDIAGAAQ